MRPPLVNVLSLETLEEFVVHLEVRFLPVLAQLLQAQELVQAVQTGKLGFIREVQCLADFVQSTGMLTAFLEHFSLNFEPFGPKVFRYVGRWFDQVVEETSACVQVLVRLV